MCRKTHSEAFTFTVDLRSMGAGYGTVRKRARRKKVKAVEENRNTHFALSRRINNIGEDEGDRIIAADVKPPTFVSKNGSRKENVFNTKNTYVYTWVYEKNSVHVAHKRKIFNRGERRSGGY